MNKVLILSDSHGMTTELEQIKKRHHVQYTIHCGDSELDTEAPQLHDFITVKGNCDWYGDFPKEEIVEIGGLRFFITHGHLFSVKTSLMQLQYRALEVGADIVCFGHSHIAFAEKLDNQLFINPGSIRLPKTFPNPSYAVLEWGNINKVNLIFYTIKGEKIVSLPYENSFKF